MFERAWGFVATVLLIVLEAISNSKGLILILRLFAWGGLWEGSCSQPQLVNRLLPKKIHRFFQFSKLLVIGAECILPMKLNFSHHM